MNDDLVKIIDFWHKSINADELIGRELVENIDYTNKEIIDLIGPRRSGKSSLLKLIISRLGLSGNFLYINFEDPYFVENNSASVIEELISVYQEYYNGNLKFLFFDEIQEIQNWEKALRKLRDSQKYKIFITGSSANLLSREMSSMLTGRHITYKVFPLDFRGYLFFKNISIDSKKDIILKDKLIQKEFDDYLKTGGFPEIVLTGNLSLLQNYFFDILQKDVMVRYDIRDKEALEKLAVYTMSNSGNLLSIASVKKAFNISYETANLFIHYLREAFLIQSIGQFSFSLKVQSKAQKKIYAIDTGLANAVSFRFSEDKGRMLENLVFLELLRKEQEIYYYKSTNNSEVDFLIKEKTKVKELIQVSWDITEKKTEDREIKSLLEAMSELKLNRACILTHSTENNFKIEGKTIEIMPVYKWILNN